MKTHVQIKQTMKILISATQNRKPLISIFRMTTLTKKTSDASGAAQFLGIRLKNIIVKVLLRLFILGTKHCEHFNYAFMSENT